MSFNGRGGRNGEFFTLLSCIYTLFIIPFFPPPNTVVISYDICCSYHLDQDEEETEQISAKRTDCLACTSPAVLPMNCIHPQFGNVDDAVSTAAAAESFTSPPPCKTSWSTGKPHRPSNFEENIQIKELSPRMQRKLANLKLFRSKSFGGMLRK